PRKPQRRDPTKTRRHEENNRRLRSPAVLTNVSRKTVRDGSADLCVLCGLCVPMRDRSMTAWTGSHRDGGTVWAEGMAVIAGRSRVATTDGIVAAGQPL